MAVGRESSVAVLTCSLREFWYLQVISTIVTISPVTPKKIVSHFNIIVKLYHENT